MKPDPTRAKEPARWRERGADAHALESRAALLVDAAAGEAALDSAALQRIRVEVASRRRHGRAPELRRRALLVRLALACVVIVASIATARGAVFIWRRYVAPPTAATPVAIASRTRTAGKRRAAVAPAEVEPSPSEAPVAEAPVPTAAAPSGAAPHAVHVMALAAHAPLGAPLSSPPAAEAGEIPRGEGSPTPTPTPTPTEREATGGGPTGPITAPLNFAAADDTEAHLLAQALAQLRQSKDPRAALATLDRSARLYPHGVLENEALRTRVEATMALPDPRAALALLDGKESFRGSLGADLLIARAELRANAGRCPDALDDFGQVLAAVSARDVEERALFGEAVCLVRVGQDERAQTDFATYRRRFPRGRFSSEVERLSSSGARRP